MQVDATTLLTPQARGQRARALVAAGLADILAADNHGDDRSIATRTAISLGRRTAPSRRTCSPGSIPAPSWPTSRSTPVPPLELRRSWLQRLRHLLEGGE